jgi:putative transcriptional regulator
MVISQIFRYFCSEFNYKSMKLNRIKVVLEDKGISQTWLAKRLNKSFSTVNSYVCNRTQPNLETLLEISNILSVDLKDLITNADERH